MFNEDLKNRYIEEKTERVTIDKFYLPNVFRKTEVFEQLLNKDLCNFTVSEIYEMIKVCGFTGYNTLANFISACSMYTNWCLNQGFVYDSQNHFLEIRPDQYSRLIDRIATDMRIATRGQIEKWIMELPNPSDKFVFLGVFEGIKGTAYCEYIDLLGEDINCDKCEIFLRATNRTLKCSTMLCEIGIESANTFSYYPLTGKMEREGKFIDSDKVIKDVNNIRTTPNPGRRIYFKLLRSIKYLGIESFFDPNALQDSGMMDMVISRSKELNISERQYVYEHIDEINNRYNKKYAAYEFAKKMCLF